MADGPASSQPIEGEIDDRRRAERQELGHQEPSDDRVAERLTDFGAGPLPKRERNGAEERRESGHHDRPEAPQPFRSGSIPNFGAPARMA